MSGQQSAEAEQPQPARGWAQVVRSVTAPLGFYVLCLLIVESVLTVVLVQTGFDAAQKFSGLLLGSLLFILVVFLTTHLVIFHPESLVFGPKDHLRRLEIERQTAAERLERAQADVGDEAAGASPADAGVYHLETIVPVDDGTSAAREYLELESASLRALARALKPGWSLVESVRVGSDVLLDAVILSPDKQIAAIVEVKAFRFRRAVGDRIRSAIYQLQTLGERVGERGNRPLQVLVWATGSDNAKPTPAQLRNLEPLFIASATFFALYTRWNDEFGFFFDTPPFLARRPDNAPFDANGKRR